MHIHLDLIGGLSGDMFIAGMLDCFPELGSSLQPHIEAAGFSKLVKLSINDADDGTLTGTHFKVLADDDAEGHHHRHYSEIRKIIGSSSLANDVKAIALEIFHHIAVVEARIHGTEVSHVAFHEVGAWDSIADIVCAASLISAVGANNWSVSKIPLGRGQVKTAHGMLPVPAPATTLLLEGFEFFDDGLEGERVTPTGAAILKQLAPEHRGPQGKLLRSGFGFGTKRFPGISNVVRVMVFDTGEQVRWDTDEVLELRFEVDDQTAEELADALERLRQRDDIIDVSSSMVFGKKGRHSASVQVLASPAAEQAVISACFAETTTLGIRRQLTGRAILSRQQINVAHNGRDYRVKLASRPGGDTAKAEIDDLQQLQGSLADRRQLRSDIETSALKDGNEQ